MFRALSPFIYLRIYCLSHSNSCSKRPQIFNYAEQSNTTYDSLHILYLLSPMLPGAYEYLDFASRWTSLNRYEPELNRYFLTRNLSWTSRRVGSDLVACDFSIELWACRYTAPLVKSVPQGAVNSCCMCLFLIFSIHLKGKSQIGAKPRYRNCR